MSRSYTKPCKPQGPLLVVWGDKETTTQPERTISCGGAGVNTTCPPAPHSTDGSGVRPGVCDYLMRPSPLPSGGIVGLVHEGKRERATSGSSRLPPGTYLDSGFAARSSPNSLPSRATLSHLLFIIPAREFIRENNLKGE